MRVDMNGIDKIIEDIKTESEATASEIVSQAGKKADAIKAAAKIDADAAVAKIRSENERKEADARTRAESAAELHSRQSILAKKQELITETFDEVRKAINELPDDRYFAIIGKMAVNEAQNGEGRICFNKNDLARLPEGFVASINAKLGEGRKLTAVAEPADISDGFVLIYEGIEQNCTFDAELSARKDEFQDRIREILF